MRHALFARRLFLIAAAIGVSCALLRPQLSSALVTRGDELSFRGDTSRALGKYDLALRFDPESNVAADRYAFTAIELHDRAALALAVIALNRAIERAQTHADLVLDRALCLQRLGAYALAARDFEQSGRALRDPRALMFAALDAKGMRQGPRARALLQEAVAMDPSFKPARRALLRSASWES